VEDLKPVRVLEAAADLKQQRNPLGDRQRTLANLVVGQRLTREIRHHQVDASVGRLAYAEDGAHVRVVEPHGDGGLAPQPLHRPRVAEQLGQQHLERDLTAVLEILGEIDRGHAPDHVARVGRVQLQS
jgi:hypothetical protein